MYENMQWTKGEFKSVILKMQRKIDSENKEYGSKIELADREQIMRKRGEVAQKTRAFNKKYKETSSHESDTAVGQAMDLSALLCRMKYLNHN